MPSILIVEELNSRIFKIITGFAVTWIVCTSHSCARTHTHTNIMHISIHYAIHSGSKLHDISINNVTVIARPSCYKINFVYYTSLENAWRNPLMFTLMFLVINKRWKNENSFNYYFIFIKSRILCAVWNTSSFSKGDNFNENVNDSTYYQWREAMSH